MKNAVNAFQKKNWIGTFRRSLGGVNDAALLSTLPDRDFLCGFVEAVKVALLKDPAFFGDLCRLAPQIRSREMPICLDMIRRSADWHLQHITRGGDPFEMLEARPLDFGHWSAHKLESLTNFAMRHGEAVAIGVAIDTVYSSLALGLPTSQASSCSRLFVEIGFQARLPAVAQRRTIRRLGRIPPAFGGSADADDAQCDWPAVRSA